MENLSSVSYSLRLSVLLESWKEWGSGKWCSGSVLSSSSKFSLRAYLPWPDLPVTHTGFWDPPPFRLLY